LRICEGYEPSVPTHCRISTIFVVGPYESVLNVSIKIKASVVDVVFNIGRKIYVEKLSMLAVIGKHISDRMVKIMNIYVRNKST